VTLYDEIGRTYTSTRRPVQRTDRSDPVPVPHDCTDGLFGAYWRRPDAYLHADVRAGISVFAQLSSGAVRRAVEALDADLETGRWHDRHRELLTMDELHLGYYLITAESTPQDRRRT
jgi:hypothetical protein